MGSTFVEKILARCANRRSVRAGDEIEARPDFMLAYELRGYTDALEREMAVLGRSQVSGPERFAVFIDHRVPAKRPEDETFHQHTREWTAQQGVSLFERKGIGHQVAVEEGYAVPGAFAIHFDGHVSQLGALGTLTMASRALLLQAAVEEKVTLRVPSTSRLVLTGHLRPGVMARDVLHHLLAQHGPRFAAGHALEIDGPGVETLSLDALQCICGLGEFAGAIATIVLPTRRLRAVALGLPQRLVLEPETSDPDATYAATAEINLGEVVPMLALPPSPARIATVQALVGTPLDAGYLGSCASGRLEDLQAAAAILAGQQLPPGFSLHVVPSSQRIMTQAAADGTLAALAAAGAFISSPSCDFCSGNIATLAPRQNAISTGTLNVPGRMGAVDANIYLASAATLAASALHGKIVDPRGQRSSH